MTRNIPIGGIPECPAPDVFWRELPACVVRSLKEMTAVRSSSSSPGCTVSARSWVPLWYTDMRWEDRGKMPKPSHGYTQWLCYAPSLSTPYQSGPEGKMHPFSIQRGISKTQPTEEGILFWEFCFNFSESWGSNAIENTLHPVLTTYFAGLITAIKGWGPYLYKQGESDIKGTKIEKVSFLSVSV